MNRNVYPFYENLKTHKRLSVLSIGIHARIPRFHRKLVYSLLFERIKSTDVLLFFLHFKHSFRGFVSHHRSTVPNAMNCIQKLQFENIYFGFQESNVHAEFFDGCKMSN